MCEYLLTDTLKLSAGSWLRSFAWKTLWRQGGLHGYLLFRLKAGKYRSLY